MPAYIIYINGWPGVGKLTVARHLQTLIPDSRVLHNHELIDPVEKRYSRTHPAYYAKRAEYRSQRLKPVAKDPALRDTVFIFTDSQAEHNECVGDYTDLALGESGRRFYSVILDCEEGENIRRLTMPGRGGAENGKLTDVEILRGYRRRGGKMRFGDQDEIEIDNTGLSAEDVAKRVLDFVERREREGRSSVEENYDDACE